MKKEERCIDITLDRLGRIEFFSLIINTLSKLSFARPTIRSGDSAPIIRGCYKTDKRFTDSGIQSTTIGLTFKSYNDYSIEIKCKDTNYVFELDDLNYLCNKETFIDVYGKDAIVNDDLIDSVVTLVCDNLNIDVIFYG